MKNKLTKFITPVALAAIAVLALGTLPAFAVGLGVNLGVSAKVNASGTVKASTSVNAAADARITTRATQEITRRVDALNALVTRITVMQKLSADEKTSLASSVQAQIGTLNDLQTKITADAASTTALRADAQSITSSYRIFALIIPQGAIIAAADRVMTIVDAMNALGVKLQARIASSTGLADFNASTTASAYADFTAKVTAAQTQAQAAANEVAALKPDLGSQTQFQANLAAMKDAHKKLQAAQQDLVAARKDAATIVKALASSTASSSASGTAQ
jgi:hypothetical protein